MNAATTRVLRRVLRQVCTGGTQWQATGATGSGVTGPTTPTAPRAVVAYVLAATETANAATLPMALVGDAQWVVYCWDSLTTGERITNAAGTQFIIGARVDVSYPLWLAEEVH